MNLLRPNAIRMLAIATAATALWTNPAAAQGKSILVQSTTSTENSGLYKHLLPLFTADSGIAVRVVAVGTGQAIKNAEKCDGDVLLVHAKAAEEKFVAQGFGVKRFDLMYNDFVVVGPAADPGKVAGSKDVVGALKKIAEAKAPFASRGDDSGTHKKELSLWQSAGVDVKAASGGWYRSTGSGMGATLNTGVGMGAYVLADRASWLAFKNKSDFTIAIEGDPKLFNQYGVILVNKAKCPSIKADLGQTFVDWLLSDKGQKAIGSYQINGKPLFFANGKKASG